MAVTEGARYEPLFDLAAGGMGVVSVARLHGEHGFRRLVAIKRIHPRLAAERWFHDALAQEARLCAAIRHPNVVQVHELVSEGGELILSMELVEGVSLRRLLAALGTRGERLDVAAAAHVVAECAHALHAAHEAEDERGRPLGIVHRDVSPHNVLVSFDGLVKVSDFGIAKVLGDHDEARSSAVRGKPAYLAPEQVRGGPVDRRTDIWSLGVIAWELFTGARLFKGGSDVEALRRVLEAPIPRADQVSRSVPAALADVVAGCLTRDPAGRFPDAQALAEAVENAVPEARRVGRTDLAGIVRRSVPEDRSRFERLLRSARAATGENSAPSRPARRGLLLRRLLFAAAGFALVLSVRSIADRVEAMGAAPVSEPAPPVASPTPAPVPSVPAPAPVEIEDEPVVAVPEVEPPPPPPEPPPVEERPARPRRPAGLEPPAGERPADEPRVPFVEDFPL